MEILIADDDPVVRHLLGSVLKAGGYEVSVAESGQAAISFISDRSAAGNLPDIVLLDVQLMDMSGGEVLKAVRSLAGERRIPVIMLSANKKEEVLRDHPGLADADSFLEKPFPPDQVLAAVAAVATK